MPDAAPDAAVDIDSINIRPGVTILSVLRHLNYKPWFALAEFVDNSLQSFLANRSMIEAAEGKPVKLQVNIEIEPHDGGRLVIRDNAAGIAQADFPRAFRPAEIPPDRSGLSEFGMGMKSAACWLSSQWKVRTCALGEPLERTVTFDIQRIVQDRIEELSIVSRPAAQDAHFTEIILEKPHRPPYGKTISKIKEHLASIYRVFLRSDLLDLYFNGEKLTFSETPVLLAPYYQSPGDTPIEWRKEIDFDFGQGLRAHGFAALRQTASVSEAGFALFRRGRLIQGSLDETYRPEAIFERANSFIYQRLFGELELEGFEVSHTKDGFRWEDDEDVFLELLKEHLNAPPLPLLDQASGHRVRPSSTDLKKAADTAALRTSVAMRRELPQLLPKLEANVVDQDPPPVLPEALTPSRREIEFTFQEQQWVISLELSTDPGISDWLSFADDAPRPYVVPGEPRRLGIRLGLAHPFMDRFGGATVGDIEPLLRVAVAVALAEVLARDSGIRFASTFRRNINELLREALSKP